MRAEAAGFVAFAVAAALLVAGCAMPQRVDAPDPDPRNRAAGGTAEVDRQLYGDLIRSMLDEGQYYAALAHVQQRQRSGGGDRNELRYLEAEARRALGQVEASDALYRGLLKTRFAAQSYHGLGLLHASRDLGAAIAHLREAARLAPTDAEVRNDLGYALLRARRDDEALLELATAVELAPESAKARNNLMLLLIVRGDEAAVSRMAREAAVPADTISRLRQQAAALRAPRGAAGGVP